MTNYDVDLELKEQQISLYEDELSEFIDNYRTSKEFRELLKQKHKATIDYEEWDECYGVYMGDDIIYMSTKLDVCLEKMFNYIKRKDYEKYLEESDLPF